MANQTTQYTITEHNDWEGESFSYIMLLTEEQADIIKRQINVGLEEELEIEETSYTQEDVEKINKASENTYMDRIGFYKFREWASLDNWEEGVGVFYKAVGLERVKDLLK